MVGYPEYSQGHIYNSACLMRGGRDAGAAPQVLPAKLQGIRRKALFHGGHARRPWSTSTASGSDCWSARTPGSRSRPRMPKRRAPRLLLIINASPYEIHKQRERELVLGQRVHETGLPAVYVNLLGGQDELVFDGNSFAMDAQGRLAMRAPPLAEGLYCVEFERRNGESGADAGPDRARMARRADSIGCWCSACATTSTSTASMVPSSGCQAASIRR